MTKKLRQGKRKREESPEYASKTRQRKSNGSTSLQQSLVTSAYPTNSDLSKLWMQGITNSNEITQEHALGACGIGRLGRKQCCNNKYAHDSTQPMADIVDCDEKEVIVLDADENVTPITTPCTKVKCRSNPYCLNYLGQEKWEDTTKAKKMVLDAVNAEFGGNPKELLREKDTPVGLRNLGATCYANAFIQVWNQDLTFRSAVFQCIPTNSEDPTLQDSSPIFQLQVTFAALTQGSLAVFDPHLLVESLKLNSTEQQDAQEFSKLFLSHLASEFAKQADPSLQNIVSNHFGGTSVYGTQCHGCSYKSERETEFLEVELHLKNNCALEECLSDALKSEVLSADNQYRCPECESLQDATRYIQLRKLPPVLHFSVQRFVFDFQTLERKKSKNVLSYPTILNMSSWHEGLDSNLDSGSSSENEYQLCGVLLHKGPSAYHGHYEAQVLDVRYEVPFIKSNAVEEHCSARQWYQFNDEVVTTIQLGQSSDDGSKEKGSSDPKRITSKDCYCLVYMRTDHVNDQKAPVQPPPTNVVARVKDLGDSAEIAYSGYEDTLTEETEKLENLRSQKAGVYRHWNVQSHSGPCKIVPQQLLQDWIESGLPSSGKKSAKSTEPPTGTITALVPDTPESVTQVVNGFQNSSLCTHGKLDPARASDFKVITPDAFHLITGDSMAPTITHLEQDICIQCVSAIYEEHSYFSRHLEAVQMVNAAINQETAEGADTTCLISRSWLKDWSLQKPKMHVAGQPDPAPCDSPYMLDLLCEHGKLSAKPSQYASIPELACTMLRELFPQWQPIPPDSEKCDICVPSGKVTSQKSKQAEMEKNTLKSFLFLGSAVINRTVATGSACAIVASAWLYAWSRWVMKPNSFPRPGPPDNSLFICSHGLLVFDPGRAIDLSNPDIAVISSGDWQAVESLYPNSGPKIEFSSLDSGACCSFSVCQGCRSSQRIAFDECSVAVIVLKPNAPAPTMESYDRHREEVGRRIDFSPSVMFTNGARRSRRARDGDNLGRFFLLKLQKSTSVKEMKLKIESSEKIPAFYQTVYYKDKELDDNDVHIGDIGVEVQDVLYIRPAEESVIKIDGDSDVELIEDSNPKGARRVESKAFEGSLLVGGQ